MENKKQRSNIIFFCCVEISSPLLRRWCEILKSTSGEIVSYVDLLNAAVVDGWFWKITVR